MAAHHKSKKPYDDHVVDFGKVASVFIVFSLVSFVTAWIFSFETEEVGNINIFSSEVKQPYLMGPIQNKEKYGTYEVQVKATGIPIQSWAYIEGQVLDSNKVYLFSFGKSLWNESGYDNEGYYWHESDTEYVIQVTLPKSGNYYLQFNVESSKQPKAISLKVVRKEGSSLPHFWFGVILLLLGITLNEIKNRTVRNIIGELS